MKQLSPTRTTSIWMPVYISDREKLTSELSSCENGMFDRLERQHWLKGYLPGSEAKLLRILREQESQLPVIRALLAEFYEKQPDGTWTRPALVAQIEKANGNSLKAKAKGSNAINTRWDRKRSVVAVAQANALGRPYSEYDWSIPGVRTKAGLLDLSGRRGSTKHYSGVSETHTQKNAKLLKINDLILKPDTQIEYDSAKQGSILGVFPENYPSASAFKDKPPLPSQAKGNSPSPVLAGHRDGEPSASHTAQPRKAAKRQQPRRRAGDGANGLSPHPKVTRGASLAKRADSGPQNERVGSKNEAEDARFEPIAKEIRTYFGLVNPDPEAELTWANADRKALSDLLRVQGKMSVERFCTVLGHRAEMVRIGECSPHEAPRDWLPKVPKWFDGPRNEFGQKYRAEKKAPRRADPNDGWNQPEPELMGACL